jgi:hypothetical protein
MKQMSDIYILLLHHTQLIKSAITRGQRILTQTPPYIILIRGGHGISLNLTIPSPPESACPSTMVVVAISITVPASWPTCRATESKGGEEETADATPGKTECFYSKRGGDSVVVQIVTSLDENCSHQRSCYDINYAGGLELD